MNVFISLLWNHFSFTALTNFISDLSYLIATGLLLETDFNGQEDAKHPRPYMQSNLIIRKHCVSDFGIYFVSERCICISQGCSNKSDVIRNPDISDIRLDLLNKQDSGNLRTFLLLLTGWWNASAFDSCWNRNLNKDMKRWRFEKPSNE